MIEHFLSPVKLNKIVGKKHLSINQWGKKLWIYEGKLPSDWTVFKMAIVGVEEDRKSSKKKGCQEGPDAVRSELYCLYNWEPDFAIADLGDIKSGATERDTYFAVQQVVAELLKHGVLPIIIGGTHDVSYGQFLGHIERKERTSVVMFDEMIDLFENGTDANRFTFLYNILTQYPNLFNFTHVGYQQYLVDPQIIDTLEKLHFECHRLGEVKSNIREIEPIVRDANMVTLDVAAIKQADAPGCHKATPHGFTGEQACQITRYAGLSDKVSSIGFYEFNPALDNNRQTAQLIAQMIWYFVEGFYTRKHDRPELDEKTCMKYIVHLEQADHELVFLKSKKSDRWWMKIPIEKDDDTIQHLVPCSYKDYELACKDEIPDRWMKAFLRLG